MPKFADYFYYNGEKRKRIKKIFLKLKTAKPREDEKGNAMNLGKDRTFLSLLPMSLKN